MRRWGLMALGVLVIMAADQASKYWVLDFFAVKNFPFDLLFTRYTHEVWPFFNLVLVANRGVSFGLLPAGSAAQVYVLAGFALAVVILLLWWVRGQRGILPSYGTTLIIGGALGNIIDRLIYHAVIDFLDFHVAGWHWPAFNIADSVIVLGCAVLLFDSLRERQLPATTKV